MKLTFSTSGSYGLFSLIEGELAGQLMNYHLSPSNCVRLNLRKGSHIDFESSMFSIKINPIDELSVDNASLK